MIYQAKKPYHYGTGRRKSSVARVRLYEGGTGKITINDRDIDDYFGLETLKLLVRQPLEATNLIGTCDVVATVQGGGVTGQAGAIRHGLARALLTVNEEYRPILKQAGLLTRDPRMKERKKYGLKAALMCLSRGELRGKGTSCFWKITGHPLSGCVVFIDAAHGGYRMPRTAGGVRTLCAGCQSLRNGRRANLSIVRPEIPKTGIYS